MITVRTNARPTSIAAQHDISDAQYAEIIRLWHRRTDTYDIGKALKLKENVVEAVLHAARERRRG